MTKILHTADFHLDSAFTALPEEKARLRRQEARQLTDLNPFGCLAATCNELNPLHDFPIIPTFPSHHGCSAIHSMHSTASSCSCFRYSS